MYWISGSQDLRHTCALTVSCVMAMDCVVNSETYENKLASGRKVGAYMAKYCGTSKDDLPTNLLMKFNEFCNGDDKSQEVQETPDESLNSIWCSKHGLGIL